MIRYEFTDMSIKEEDIHPDFVFNREREMARDFVGTVETFRHVQPCPVCGAPRGEILFKKWGCDYAICPGTWTVSLATLPEEDVLHNYFFSSELSRFRASKEYQHMVTQKRKNLWESQIGWIEGRVNRYLGNKKYTVVDWGGKFVGWIDFLKTASFVDTLIAKESLPPINECSDVDRQADIVCLIDALQREARPQNLLQRIAKILKSDGLLIVSCRSGSGFDVLTLQEESESIFPFDHVFLPSPKGMQFLFEQVGFDVLELTTPGLMDVKYIKTAGGDIPRDQYFQRYIMEQEDELLLERLQGFLQRNNLSSHLRCVARKK